MGEPAFAGKKFALENLLFHVVKRPGPGSFVAARNSLRAGRFSGINEIKLADRIRCVYSVNLLGGYPAL